MLVKRSLTAEMIARLWQQLQGCDKGFSRCCQLSLKSRWSRNLQATSLCSTAHYHLAKNSLHQFNLL
jgi:hypothetical protein